MAATLIDVAMVKDEIRVVHTEEDAVIQRKCDEAEDLILNYLKMPGSPFTPETPWTAETVPPNVRAAILYTAVELYYHRGDDERAAASFPSPYVKGQLMRWRDPAYA